MRHLIILATSLLMAYGCLGKEAIPAVTPGNLNANKNLFDKKEVSVKGILLYETENTALWDVDGNYPNGSPYHCITVLSSSDQSTHLSSLNHKLVVITGIFSKNFMKPNGIILGACNVTGINVISARPAGVGN
ncbi:hypothetical protein [Rhodanobacter sp. DHG33]|uniref:hypothetical protein n=1 Tax=Rhodanobacter sp. DHG33 TaxID=2775921 RepID=UPI00177ED7C0|nr:hypothetical protein [Rhodanobacter sp. DHG33]MBD8900579.1 hypothetical protein [Rhodanobacter sp. DHG33]